MDSYTICISYAHSGKVFLHKEGMPLDAIKFTLRHGFVDGEKLSVIPPIVERRYTSKIGGIECFVTVVQDIKQEQVA